MSLFANLFLVVKAISLFANISSKFIIFSCIHIKFLKPKFHITHLRFISIFILWSISQYESNAKIVYFLILKSFTSQYCFNILFIFFKISFSNFVSTKSKSKSVENLGSL